MSELKSLCVYCGHKFGADPLYKDAAAILGKSLAENRVKLIYGGGELGLMGTVASAARDNNGDVFGVIPEFLVETEGILDGVEHQVVDTMHERKMLMFEKADAICTMPGGIGTLEEIIEILSWARLDLHRKPIILLNLDGFWTPLVNLLNHIIDQGFAAEELRHDLVVVEKAEDVVQAAEQKILRAKV
ncbi:MAG: LOG family protein [bacterium]